MQPPSLITLPAIPPNHKDSGEPGPPPLFVDLDGTLVRSDLLYESLLSLLKRRPGLVFVLPLWLARGRAYLKRQVAREHDLDVSTLPYHEPLCAYLRDEAQRGRTIVLATATDQLIAEPVARHLGFFDSVLASDGATNLKSKEKLAAIQAASGNGPFAYVGNAADDLPIWAAASECILVGTSARVTQGAAKRGNVRHHLDSGSSTPAALFRALRVQQWPKNLLVFVALLTSFSFGDPVAWLRATQAFVAFCLVASGIYILNDLLDLQADRRHPLKRKRSFAAGDAPPQLGLIASAITIVGGLLLGYFLPSPSIFWLAGYLALSVTYSLKLKAMPVVDVIVLAALYTLRVVFGAAAIGVEISFWLLIFTIFFFFSLATLKRCSEITLLAATAGGSGNAPPPVKLDGRDYRFDDAPTLRALGIASGVSSVAMFALYINAPENLSRFASPQILWLICPLLLYWIAVTWISSDRGEIHDDPVSYTLRDRKTRVVAVAIACVFVAAAVLHL